MTPQTIEKYRQAAIIAQNALSVVISLLHRNIGEQTIGEVCRMGDNYIQSQVKRCFKPVEEKGVARPVEICKNEFVSGIAPESHDKFQAGFVNVGDVLKISLGVHIDGFTVIGGHTVVIRDDGDQQQQQPLNEPFVGIEANAMIGAFLATEAVVSLLSSALSDSHPLRGAVSVVTGAVIRQVVEEIASTFGLVMVPGSRVRRIKRFVVGQPTVQDNLPIVEWRPHSNDDESKLISEMDAEFVATAGHTYTIDLQMAPKLEANGYIKLVEVPSIGSAIDGPSIYTRDQTVTYQLRTNAARQLLKGVDKQLSVFPFKLSYLSGTMSVNQLKLGLNECIQRHLIVGDSRLKTVFVPEYRPKDTKPVTAAREVATVSLIPGKSSGSGYPELFRMSGGRHFPPSWVHSANALGPGLAAEALNSRMMQHQGIKYIEAKPTERGVPSYLVEIDGEPSVENNDEMDEMDIEA